MHRDAIKNSAFFFRLHFPGVLYWVKLPAFTGWLSLMTGIFLASQYSLAPEIMCNSLYNAAIIGAITLTGIAVLYHKNPLLRNGLFMILGILVFSRHSHQLDIFFTNLNLIQCDTNEKIIMAGKVVSPPLQVNRDTEFLVAAEYIYTSTDTLCLHGAVFKCRSFSAPPSYGAITATGTLRLPRPPFNPYTFDEYAYLISSGVRGRLFIDTFTVCSRERSLWERCENAVHRTTMQTISCVSDPSLRGILQAVFLGEKNNLSANINERFRQAGIYHLLALSGLHVGILIASIFLFLSLLPISKKIKIVLTILSIWGYLLFIGYIPSLFRAVVMATLLLLSTIVQKNNHTLNTLGVAGIIWLCFSPVSLFTPGFQLSFSATFGIITLHPLFSKQGIPITHKPLLDFFITTVLTCFYVSFAGFIATAPVLAFHFGSLSLFGLIANIGAVSLMGITMNTLLLGILTHAIWLPLSHLFMRATEITLSGIVMIADSSMRFPWAAISIPLPYTEFIILYCLFFCGFIVVARNSQRVFVQWATPALFFCIPAILLLRLSCAPHSTEIVFFDTRSGSMTGIRFPDNNVWLLYAPDRNTSSIPYENIVSAWLRHYPFHSFRAVVIPAVNENSVHELLPIFEENAPENIILCSPQPDGIFRDDFAAFLEEYQCSTIDASCGLILYPADKCTCFVYQNNQKRKWYTPVRPASIIMSINGFRLYYQIPGPSFPSDDRYITILTDSTLQISPSSFTQNQGKHLCTSISETGLWQLHERGALRMYIDRGNRISIK